MGNPRNILYVGRFDGNGMKRIPSELTYIDLFETTYYLLGMRAETLSMLQDLDERYRMHSPLLFYWHEGVYFVLIDPSCNREGDRNTNPATMQYLASFVATAPWNLRRWRLRAP